MTIEITYRDHFNAFAHKFFVPEDERVSSVKTRFVADNAKEAYYGLLARDKLIKARHQ